MKETRAPCGWRTAGDKKHKDRRKMKSDEEEEGREVAAGKMEDKLCER